MPCRRGNGFEISPPAALQGTLPQADREPRPRGFGFYVSFPPPLPRLAEPTGQFVSHPIHVVTSRGASALFPLLLAGWSLASKA